MLRRNEMADAAVTTIGRSMGRWKRGRLCDDEPELVSALQAAIDLSGGLRWIEARPGVQDPLIAPMRAGEFTSFDWDAYRSELCVPYHHLHVWLAPDIGEELMEHVGTLLR